VEIVRSRQGEWGRAELEQVTPTIRFDAGVFLIHCDGEPVGHQKHAVKPPQVNRAIPAHLIGVYTMDAFIVKALCLKNDRDGVTALEYGIIASILGLVLVGIFTSFGKTLTTLFSTVATSL
jgi:pilus assembly protein Flp/PilA